VHPDSEFLRSEMATEIANQQIRTDLCQEVVTLMDDYGTASIVQIAVTEGNNRAAIIAARQAQMDANQVALESYAMAHGHDLSAQKSAGQAKRAALQIKNSITTH
jgi:hypothetical protein